jgi:prepilin-type N-terminal cleavage/methylation domain-containing protein
MTTPARKADGAFSLPELMVTMGILGLVGLMVFSRLEFRDDALTPRTLR